MKINKNNYEIYFLDYLEGRLTPDEQTELLLFVDENPDLRALLEGEELVSLNPDNAISFFPKSALKKKTGAGEEIDMKMNSSLNAENHEEWMIRFYENDLNDVEKAKLADFLNSSPFYLKEFELFGSTVLQPDPKIVFSHKSRLKHNLLAMPVTRRVFTAVAVAASVVLFSTLLLKYLNQPIRNENGNQLAENHIGSTEPGKPKTADAKTFKIATNDNRSSGYANLSNSSSRPGGNVAARPDIKRAQPESAYKAGRNAFYERPGFEVPPTLILHPASLKTLAQINAPQSIARRTDFDGITSIAYYDPDPEALPINSGGLTIGGRLGSSLA
ncbi:MAG: hypothetical protein Q8908_16045, partial [Bacteroidota bacterium]|nr:hypothetical protein [Bacteroidota bacterium]